MKNTSPIVAGVEAHLVTQRGPAGGAIERITVTDARRNPVTARDAKGTPTDLEYTAFDLLTSAEQTRGGLVTATVFDDWGRKESIVDPDAGSITYEYNGFDEKVAETDARGIRTELTLDGLGRTTLAEETTPISGGSEVRLTSFDYDPPGGIGKLGQSISPDGHVVTYDYKTVAETGTGKGLLESVTRMQDGIPFITSYEYNSQGQVQKVTYPASVGPTFSVEHEYDAFGHLTKVRDPVGTPSPKTYWAYVASHQGYALAGDVVGNGVTTTRTYHPLNSRVTDIESAKAGATTIAVQDLHYEFEPNGNLELRENAIANRVETFGYDELDRLEWRREGPTILEQFAYDARGNITEKLGVGTYTYHLGTHAVEQAGDWTYSAPDASGNQAVRENLTLDITQEILYTGFGLPRSVMAAGGTGAQGTITFAYDAQRARSKEVSPLGTRFYVGEHYTQWVPASGPKEHRYSIFAGSRRIADLTRHEEAGVMTSEDLRYFHVDNLGSTDAITPETLTSQGQVEHQSYLAFGELGAGAAVTLVQRYGFTGHEHDYELGLVNMRGRMFDPITSRFISPDPIVHNETWSQAWNRYSYVLNNPYRYVDPTGFDLLDDLGSVFETLVVGTVGALRGALVGQAIAYLIAGAACGATLGGACLASALFIGAYFGGVVGGLSGIATGARGIYDWKGLDGIGHFIADNTYGAFGTTLGDVMNIANIIKWDAEYVEGDSRRQNRQVYFDGVRLEGDSAFTQGNVIAMTEDQAPGSAGYAILLAHETDHVITSRFAGVFMQASYVATVSVGVVAATGDLLTGPGWENASWKRWFGIARTVGYNNNPFELFAYAMHNPTAYCAPDSSWALMKNGCTNP